MMNIDFDYLAEVGHAMPATGVRWGCSFDGQRLALVGYAICGTGRSVPGKDPGVFVAEKAPTLFFATSLSGCPISRAVRTFDQIAEATGQMGLTLVMRGLLGRREVFARHLKQVGRHGLLLFNEGQGRWFDPAEVVAVVGEDKEEGLIRLAPEFEDRPERVLLDEEIGLIDLDSKLSPLQEAFVYGLGYWSAREKRPKYYVGPSNFAIY
jgi:hypothetical protein